MLRCNAVMRFDINHKEGVHILTEEIKTNYPDYAVHVVPDPNISD